MVDERFDFLCGEPVWQLWFWGMIRLRFDHPDKASYEVDVQRVKLTAPDGSAAEFDAAGPPMETAPMLGLLKQEVTDAFAEDGILTLRFADGSQLEALPDACFESWTVHGPNGTTQCMPGGELGHW